MRTAFDTPLRLVVLAAGLLAAACGSHSPSGPSTPASNPPQIACPADVSVSSVPTATQVVEYAAPTVSAGAAPVSTVCAPESGAAFPLGATTVNCAATDAQARKATCSFTVTLKGFSLGLTKFDAFGDSLTAGETGRPNFVDAENSYPTKLAQALNATYPDQGITIINRGNGGDIVEKTRQAIIRNLPSDRPDAVLLLTGYNDLTSPCGPGLAATIACRDAIERNVALGVRDCMREIKEANAGVRFMFVSTLTPPGPSGSNRIDGDAIIQANARLRQMIASEGGVLVDAYPLFVGHEADYVNVDGLHLRPAGYQALADAFFAAIQATIPRTPLFGFRLPGS